jgi:hypothetical protein
MQHSLGSTSTASSSKRRLVPSLVTSALLVVGLGCGDDGGNNEVDGGSNGDPADAASNAPVVSSSPSEGERGVLVDQSLILTFSKAMNTASVEAAWSSTSLPASDLNFSWNAANTILSIDASAVLEYPAGDENVDRFGYTITLDDTAEAADGNALDAAFNTSFETARDVTMQLARVVATTGGFDGNGVTTDIRVGDTPANGTYRGFISIDLSTLPTVVQFTTASVFARQTDVVATPYIDLGDLLLEHLSAIAAIDQAAYTASPLAEVGVFSNSTAVANPGGDRSLDVRDEIAADYAASNSSSTFRLDFATAQDLENDDDHVIFDPTSVRLDVRLLAE